MKTAYIIHGWGGSPREALHQWLRKELEGKGYKVLVPEMPNTDEPHIGEWVGKLKEIIEPSGEVVLVGHSIGCQTILRYLAELDGQQKIAKAVLIAPWMNLNMEEIKKEGEESVAIANEWIKTPLDFERVKSHIKEITAIFSDDDPEVPLSDKEIFTEKLGAKIIIEKNKGHFTEGDGVDMLQSALDESSHFSSR